MADHPQQPRIEPTQPDPVLKEGRASPLHVTAVFGGAAVMILVLIYGINSQHPVVPTGQTAAVQTTAEPDLPTVPGSAPRTADEAAAAATSPPQDAAAPTPGDETQGAAPTAEPRDPPAVQPERGTADQGQPGQAAGDTPAASHPAERQSGAEERLNQ